MSDRARTAPLGYPAEVASRAELERRVTKLEDVVEEQRRMLDQALGRDGNGGELGVTLRGLEASRDKLGCRIGKVEQAADSLRRWRAGVVAIGGLALLVIGALIKIAADRLFRGGAS